jgi:hypothetical protein
MKSVNGERDKQFWITHCSENICPLLPLLFLACKAFRELFKVWWELLAWERKLTGEECDIIYGQCNCAPTYRKVE